MPPRSLLLALALTGCGVERRTAPAPAPPPPRAERGPSQPQASAAAPVLALDPEGFRLVDPSSGSTRVLPFGTEGERALAAVVRLHGEPGEQGVNTECGAGPLDYASWESGLTMHASDGRFVGWSVAGARSGSAGAISTMAGIGVGSTRADLDGSYDARVSETTLGTEFEAGGLFGLLSGPEPEAEVTFLWAGVSCNFR